MRLLPRSLFSRLVLVLLAGLVIAQLLSFAIHMHERGELLSQASGMQSAQRIADIVKLLDTLDPSERSKIVAVLSAAPLTISLNQGASIARERRSGASAAKGAHGPANASLPSSPTLLPEGEGSVMLPSPLGRGTEGEGRFMERGLDQSAHATLFEAMLRRFLGEGWQVDVAVRNSDTSVYPGAMHGFKGAGKGMAEMPFNPGMRYFLHPGFSFVAQVRLRDGAIVTFDSRQPAETTNWPYRMLLSLAVLLAAVIVVSLIAVRWATRPLNTLADAAEELGKNINRAPLQERGPLEVRRAARAFNLMQTRLIRYISDRTRILAAMSHDLKTPITRLRLRSEMLDDAQLKTRFTRDLEEMESMVGATLDFMRGVGNEEPLKPIDMVALLESLQADMLEMGGQVKIEGEAHKPYHARPQALKRCLTNLLHNAIKYGKSAVISVSDDDRRLEIRIRDEGPGIPQSELEKVFDPFYRLEDSRNRETGGTGLGLTIARSIAESHGGQLALRNLSQGGLEVVLTLPRQY